MEQHTIQIADHSTTIETPDGFGAMMVAAFCDAYGYTETVKTEDAEEVPNPVSREQFAALQLVAHARTITADYHIKQSTAAAKTKAEAKNGDLADQITVI